MSQCCRHLKENISRKSWSCHSNHREPCMWTCASHHRALYSVTYLLKMFITHHSLNIVLLILNCIQNNFNSFVRHWQLCHWESECFVSSSWADTWHMAGKADCMLVKQRRLSRWDARSTITRITWREEVTEYLLQCFFSRGAVRRNWQRKTSWLISPHLICLVALS